MNMGVFKVWGKTIQIIPLTQFDRIVYTVIWGSYSLNDLMYHCTTPLILYGLLTFQFKHYHPRKLWYFPVKFTQPIILVMSDWCDDSLSIYSQVNSWNTEFQIVYLKRQTVPSWNKEQWISKLTWGCRTYLNQPYRMLNVNKNTYIFGNLNGQL